MNEQELGHLIKRFCKKNGVPEEKNFLHLLAEIGGAASEIFSKNEKVNASIKSITGKDSMMVCPTCNSHVIIEYKECIACGEELYEGASSEVVKPVQPKVKKEEATVDYPSAASIKKMKKNDLEELVNLLELDVDLEGKLADIRKAIIAEIEELQSSEEAVKASEEDVEEEDVLDEDADLDGEFEEEEFEEEVEEELEEEPEEEFEEEEPEEPEEEFEEGEEELDEDGEEELDEEFEEESDDEFEEEFEEEVEEELEEEPEEEFEEEEFEEEEFEEEEPEEKPKKVTKKKVTKKASTTKKVTKKASTKTKPSEKLNDQKNVREDKKANLKKKIPALAKNPALLDKLGHAERVSLQSMLGDEQGNKKQLSELKGEEMIKQLKKQLVLWKKSRAKK